MFPLVKRQNSGKAEVNLHRIAEKRKLLDVTVKRA